VALPINVKPYKLQAVIGSDSYLTYYKARGEKGEAYIITEFFPAYMVKREGDGVLGISEQFSKEYFTSREEFIRRAESLREIRDATIHPIVEVFERNNTAYIVCRVCSMTPVSQFMGSQTMDYDEAYYFIRPLVLSMAQAAEQKILFNVNPEDFRVNTFKKLMICSAFSWETDIRPSITKIAELYYKLVTGMDAPEQNAPPISAYGIEIPVRVEQFIMEILGGDILYGSIDDFYKKFKSVIDVSSAVAGNDDKKSLKAMKITIAALSVACMFSLILLVVGGVRAYRTNFRWADPELFVSADAPPAPHRDLSDMFITHPRNTADVLSGCFATHDGYRYFRGEGGLMNYRYGEAVIIPGASGFSATAEERLIVPNVLPSFIVGHGRYVYFVDMNDGLLYKVMYNGTELSRVFDFPVLNLAVIGDTLYYTDDSYNLYALDIKGGTTRLVYNSPVYATHANGDYLFFVSGEGSSRGLYSWNTAAEPPEVVVLASSVAPRTTIRTWNNKVFFIDANRQVNSCDYDGRRAMVYEPENVAAFDVYNYRLFFTEQGRHVLRAYDLQYNEFSTLAVDTWVSYVWTRNGRVYGVDFNDGMRVRVFEGA